MAKIDREYTASCAFTAEQAVDAETLLKKDLIDLNRDELTNLFISVLKERDDWMQRFTELKNTLSEPCKCCGDTESKDTTHRKNSPSFGNPNTGNPFVLVRVTAEVLGEPHQIHFETNYLSAAEVLDNVPGMKDLAMQTVLNSFVLKGVEVEPYKKVNNHGK